VDVGYARWSNWETQISVTAGHGLGLWTAKGALVVYDKEGTLYSE